MRHLHRTDSGFTLVEICVAMALLVVAATGVAHMFGVAVRATQRARVETSATVLASQKVEQLRALLWTIAADGSPRSDWTTNAALEPFASGGAGLAASPSNSLDGNVTGYVDYLDARGDWVGTGATPPVTARYIRRWNIRPLPESPEHALVLRVLVTSVEQDRQARTPRERLAGDALITTVLSRHVR